MSIYPRLVATVVGMQGQVGRHPSLRYSLTQVLHQTERDIDAFAPYPPVDVIQVDKNGQVQSALESLAGYVCYAEKCDSEYLKREMKTIGEWVGKRLLPEDCFCCLGGNVPRTIEILTDQQEIPWELTWVNDGFLSEKCVHARYPFVSRARHATLAYRTVPRMAIVVGWIEGLDFAQHEIDALCSLYRARFCQKLELFRGEGVSPEGLRAMLSGTFGGAFDVIHFIGHGDSQDGKVWLELARTPFLDNYVPARLRGSPIVFWNACYSAVSTRTRWRYQADVIDAFGSRLLSAGASHFVGSLFPIRNSTATEFATSFYTRIFNGEEIGVAVFNAKTTVGLVDPLVHTYALYGNPAVKVINNV